MESYGINAIIETRNIRILAANTKEITETARKFHDLYPTANAALGRVMAIAALMVMNLKEEGEKIQISINGNGPLGAVFVEAKSNGDLKGFVGDPSVYLKYNDSQKLAVGLAVGTDGYLKVTRFSNEIPFTSQVKIQTGEIGDDFAYYFALSEQVPSVVACGVLVDTDYSTKSSGALIAQLLPGHKEEDIVYLEEVQKSLRPLSTLLDEGMKIEEIILEYFPEAKILEKRKLQYRCDCNRDRFLKGLLTLNDKDLDEVLQDDDIVIKCEFCDKTYHFSKEDIKRYRNV